MWKIIGQLFDDNARQLKKYGHLVTQINNYASELKNLSDQALQGQTAKLKAQLKTYLDQGKSEAAALDLLLPEAFATVREVADRVLGLRHFEVQLLAGIGLHYGKITEQKTGEGKTLTVTCPLYLNALLEKGVQLVTVNDYLAEIGAGWMGQIYHFLGLKTAVIIHDQAKMFAPEVQSEDRGDERLEHFVPISRQQAYLCDIVYGTNNEFGFDYLRDNMVSDLSQMVQRQDYPHHYAIVDEADSILIDEARTPLIISAPDSKPTHKYHDYARMVLQLVKDSDYSLDEKAKTATLTDLGVKRLEAHLGVKNLYQEQFDTIHYLENALKAQVLYHRDKEYIVKDEQIIIVDEHTGRLMHGRRYSNGLHQAIEAKEGVPIQQESRTLATISLQNYFRLYHKLAGMTGTAATEAEEFSKIYHTGVLIVPTHLPVKRQDKNDLIYKTAAAKYSALVAEVETIHQTGQPILIGTRSIEHNQIVSHLLQKKGIKHQVLNAKNNEREAFIIAAAGKKDAITVATNIAGRGVDIVLGGAKPEIKDFRRENNQYDELKYQAALKDWQQANSQVKALGGLAILGAERHESRRIDNQLRGRAGRQGDPGSSRFYVALDDEIMRIFGGEQIAKLMEILKIPASQPIEARVVGKSIESAQTRVEGFFFDQRQRLVEFDDVMNKQREIIYKKRRQFLQLSSRDLDTTSTNEVTTAGETLRTHIWQYLDEAISNNVTASFSLTDDSEATHKAHQQIGSFINKIIPFDATSQQNLDQILHQLGDDSEKIITKLQGLAKKTYQAREQTIGKELTVEIEKQVILSTIDQLWMDHLDAMEDLRQGIWMRGDKNTVIAEYKKEAFALFEKLMAAIKQTIVERIFRTEINPQALVAQQIAASERLLAQAQTSDGKTAAAPLPSAQQQKVAAPNLATKGDSSSLAAALKQRQERLSKNPGINPTSQPITIGKTKVGRNDPCPCGSGKKYKKCCGRAS